MCHKKLLLALRIVQDNYALNQQAGKKEGLPRAQESPKEK